MHAFARLIQICSFASTIVASAAIAQPTPQATATPPVVASPTPAVKPVTAVPAPSPTPIPPVVVAPTDPAKKTVDEQLSDMRAAVTKRLRVGVSVNTAATMKGIDFRTASAVIGTGEASTSNTPALDFVWVNKLYDGPDTTKFDWFVGATIERERTLSSLTFKAVNAVTPQNVTIPAGQTPTFRGNLFTLGLRWTPKENLFFPVALNYGFLTQGSWGSFGTFEMNPVVGYTIGVGYRLNPNLEFEAAWKLAKYSMILLPTNSGGNYLDGSVELSGLVVGGRFIF